MKEEQKVWIRGVEGRGEEVINKFKELVEIHCDYDGNHPDYIYFINHDNEFDVDEIDTEMSKIIMENYKELKLDPIKEEYHFEPFDKVLVRDCDSDLWTIDFFERISKKDYRYICLGAIYDFCIPYNEDTKHLIGISDNYNGTKNKPLKF